MLPGALKRQQCVIVYIQTLILSAKTSCIEHLQHEVLHSNDCLSPAEVGMHCLALTLWCFSTHAVL
jgi:hypothetical protein